MSKFPSLVLKLMLENLGTSAIIIGILLSYHNTDNTKAQSTLLILELVFYKTEIQTSFKISNDTSINNEE